MSGPFEKLEGMEADWSHDIMMSVIGQGRQRRKAGKDTGEYRANFGGVQLYFVIRGDYAKLITTEWTVHLTNENGHELEGSRSAVERDCIVVKMSGVI